MILETKSNIVHNFSNNIITLGGKLKEHNLIRGENIFVAEIMNEISHLPYKSVLIPLIKKIGVPTKSSTYNDVKYSSMWELENGYLNLNRKGHVDGLSVQTDATIILKDYGVFIEFKKPHHVPSQNSVNLQQIGRMILLAEHYRTNLNYDYRDYKIVLVNNSAPYVHIPKMGKQIPGEVIEKYFVDREDKWFKDEKTLKIIKPLLEEIDVKAIKSCFIVLNWVQFIESTLEVILNAEKDYENDEEIKFLLEKSKYTILDSFERRKHLLTVNTCP
ncbi:MAG: hypothetical protein J7L61_04100 [Thermoplasmata archaeon]|nr:hypothetical protein [Thermoplasmata archaeon]